MRLLIPFIVGIALVALLLGGCDTSDEPKRPSCRGSDGRQLQQSGPTAEAGCALGHGNTQSTDRKW